MTFLLTTCYAFLFLFTILTHYIIIGTDREIERNIQIDPSDDMREWQVKRDLCVMASSRQAQVVDIFGAHAAR